MSEIRDDHLERVRALISDAQGVDRNAVTPDADLYRDIGIAGEDAAELFAAFDKEFDID